MAVYTTTTDVYNVVCLVLLEDYASGLYPGLSLGVVSEQDFFNLLSDVLQDFILRTGLVYSIFTQQLNAFVPTYQNPNDMNEVKVAFVGGQYIDHLAMFDLDDWQYQWEASSGTPEYWVLDGQPPKTLQVAPNPNYSGASYVMPVGPNVTTPVGIYGQFNGATPGQYTGTLVVSGTNGTWLSGNNFDVNWSVNYYPPPNMTINGIAYPLASVTSPTALVFTVAPSVGVYTWTVNISQDGNLTLIGPTGLDAVTFTLNQVIPVVPDSLTPALSYGVLARIFSADSETKDLQRAYYCQARYEEFCRIGSSISGEMNNIGN